MKEPPCRVDVDPPLPAELRALVTRCVRASHTRGRDRDVVERELIGHLQDALDAGCSIARVAAEFGDPKRSGILIGRARVRLSGGRKRNAVRVVALGAAAAVVVLYTASAISLHSRLPATLVAAHESVPPALLERRAIDEGTASSLIDTLLDRMYADNRNGGGTLTADGLRIVQRLKGVNAPSRAALVIEPLYFAFPASRHDVRREADRVLALARDARTAGAGSNAWLTFEREVARFDWTRPRAYRYVPLAIVLPKLAAAMRARAALAGVASAVSPN